MFQPLIFQACKKTKWNSWDLYKFPMTFPSPPRAQIYWLGRYPRMKDVEELLTPNGVTWRIISGLGSVVHNMFITMVSLSPPKDRVVGPLPNGLFMIINWGYWLG